MEQHLAVKVKCKEEKSAQRNALTKYGPGNADVMDYLEANPWIEKSKLGLKVPRDVQERVLLFDSESIYHVLEQFNDEDYTELASISNAGGIHLQDKRPKKRQKRDETQILADRNKELNRAKKRSNCYNTLRPVIKM